ncbi:anti-sigma factor [Planococcus sp. APC 4015]|nr:anti-sigma factor [Planococcus sp. APC 4015]
MNEQKFAELAAGHAMNALSPADLESFESALAQHPEWTHIVQSDAAIAAGLAEGTPPVAPPLAMRSTLLSMIAALPQDARDVDDTHDADEQQDAGAPPVHAVAPLEQAAEPPASTGEFATTTDFFATVDQTRPVEPPTTTSGIQAIARRNWSKGLFSLAASLVLLVAIGFGAVNLNQWIGRSPAVVALNEIESAPDAQAATVEIADGEGVATAHWSGSLGKAVLVTEGLPTLTTAQTFEMWFVRDDGTPISAGTFAEPGEATTLLAGTIEVGDTIAITVEEAGGSPSGLPTTDPIVAIPTV